LQTKRFNLARARIRFSQTIYDCTIEIFPEEISGKVLIKYSKGYDVYQLFYNRKSDLLWGGSEMIEEWFLDEDLGEELYEIQKECEAEIRELHGE
jgi:hypothetical protein